MLYDSVVESKMKYICEHNSRVQYFAPSCVCRLRVCNETSLYLCFFVQKGASFVFWQDFEAMWIIFIYIMCVFILLFHISRTERASCYDLLLEIDLQRES